MRHVVVLAALSLSLACAEEQRSFEPIVEVGVFFGGQMQRLRRVEVPAVRRPKIGFRVRFPAEAPARAFDEPIEYQVVRPGPVGRRVTESGKLTPTPSEFQVDQVISLAPERRLGVWNVRVVQGDRLLADRALYLVSPPASAR